MTEASDTPAAITEALPRFVSVKQAAISFNRDPRSIRRWIEKGHLPACRVGRGLFLDRRDIEKLIADGLEKTSRKAGEDRARPVRRALQARARNSHNSLNTENS